MKKLAELFGSSSRELKSVRTITVCAMLAAAAIILVNFRIELTNTQRIGFSGIPNQLVAYLFGPAVSCLFAGALDIIKYLIKPVGAFFPGLTLVTMLAGLIYGFFFYKKPLKFTRVLAAHFLVCLVCNVILNTLCLSILYGQAFMLLLPPRVIQNIVKWPIDSFIFSMWPRCWRCPACSGLSGEAGPPCSGSGRNGLKVIYLTGEAFNKCGKGKPQIALYCLQQNALGIQVRNLPRGHFAVRGSARAGTASENCRSAPLILRRAVSQKYTGAVASPGRLCYDWGCKKR